MFLGKINGIHTDRVKICTFTTRAIENKGKKKDEIRGWKGNIWMNLWDKRENRGWLKVWKLGFNIGKKKMKFENEYGKFEWSREINNNAEENEKF